MTLSVSSLAALVAPPNVNVVNLMIATGLLIKV